MTNTTEEKCTYSPWSQQTTRKKRSACATVYGKDLRPSAPHVKGLPPAIRSKMGSAVTSTTRPIGGLHKRPSAPLATVLLFFFFIESPLQELLQGSLWSAPEQMHCPRRHQGPIQDVPQGAQRELFPRLLAEVLPQVAVANRQQEPSVLRVVALEHCLTNMNTTL